MSYAGYNYQTEHSPPPNSAYNWASAPPYADHQSQPAIPASAPSHAPYYMSEQVNPNRGDLQTGFSNPNPYSNPGYSSHVYSNPVSPNVHQTVSPNSTSPSIQYSHQHSFSTTAAYPNLSGVPPLYSAPNPPSYNYNNPTAPSYSSYNQPYDSSASRFDDSHSCENRDNYHFGGSYDQQYQDYSGGMQDSSTGYGFDRSNYTVDDGGFGGDVYPYNGGKTEPYGARGTASRNVSIFDDYGNLKTSKSDSVYDDYGNLKSSKSNSDYDDYSSSTKIAKAIPKSETNDSYAGVQKFRVKLLPDSGSQSTMDVLCQIGLDGIRMLDPSTNRTLRIYSLDNVTRWEVTDPSVFTFWSKTSVDLEPKRIRLQSSRYTTSTILDTVAAACVQFREMIDDRNAASNDASKTSEQQTERKKNSFAEWMMMRRPAEEKDHWVPDEAVKKCTSCGTDFSAFIRRHHCRNCGDIFCDKCTQGRVALTADKDAQPVRVCDRCLAEVTQRLANTKEASNKATAPRSHEDLAKRLIEEMGKNRKGSDNSSSLSSFWASQSNSEASGKRTKEVACPICTVHLQVQLPSSGTEKVECGVCQHPFLVSAR